MTPPIQEPDFLQPTLFNDPDAATEVIKEEAIEAVSRGADQDWWSAATRGVRVLAKRQQYLTSDDVWSWLRPLEVQTHDPRAMGAIMRLASRDRAIQATNDWCTSGRPACHRRPIRIWKSLTYQTDEA